MIWTEVRRSSFPREWWHPYKSWRAHMLFSHIRSRAVIMALSSMSSSGSWRSLGKVEMSVGLSTVAKVYSITSFEQKAWHTCSRLNRQQWTRQNWSRSFSMVNQSESTKLTATQRWAFRIRSVSTQHSESSMICQPIRSSKELLSRSSKLKTRKLPEDLVSSAETLWGRSLNVRI